MASTPFPQGARDSSNPEASSPLPLKGLASLPPEVHHLVADCLPYPDLLSLKLTNTYFAALVEPRLTIRSRISWVQSRYAQHLPVPTSTRLSFKSDALFVANPEVKTILRRRRRHLECAAHERGSAFVFSMFARVDVQGQGQGRRDGPHAWTKVCLVTGDRVCPRIQALEAKMQRYKDSVVGKLAVLPVLRAIGWLKGWQRHFCDAVPWVMAGRLRASGVHRAYFLALLKIVLAVVVIWIACQLAGIWMALCGFAERYWYSATT
ncbi:uncharacterized protein PV07_09743 [Cladophialophora immunda]|uniref:F-box domain-containing protein n=1 Tax=Cladophialophora immunda TaxID=569365 RepID=A0A0D2BY62_9EURO|nr:uncharacterized protein PV07_09743 [Cladophialophora immunda]KIW24003.1 hypothetical protein PV07_09743 [Cladophialophora immunda]